MARVGVPDSERRRRQKILVDLELSLDLKSAGRLDRVEATIDYAAVVNEVRSLVESHPFRLVEAMAELAAERILVKFKPKAVSVRIRKFSVPGTESVGTEITRRGRSRTR